MSSYSAKIVFCDQLLPLLIENKNPAIVPLRVYEELEKHSKSQEKRLREDAFRGLSILSEFQKSDILDIRGEKSDPFADNVFLIIFQKFITRYNLCLITQDKNLTQDILSLRNRKSISFKKQIKVLRVDIRQKVLVDSERITNTFVKSEKVNSRSVGLFAKNRTKTPALFNLSPKVTPVGYNTLLPSVDKLPLEGDLVNIANHGSIKLVRKIGEGGEGAVYLTETDHVCKIYKEKRRTVELQQKLNLMINKPVNFSGICWPQEMVFNHKGQFLGYLMDKAVGLPIQPNLTIKQQLKKHFPAWTRTQLVNLCCTILEKISHLHSHNVILGDINLFNILLKDDSTVFFVDTDSYQIEKYPCPVGTVNFTAKEIQEKDFKTFLRTKEHEYFAIATLIFMILMPGKPPYSHEGGGDPAENIKKGHFSYPFGDEYKSENVPSGPWRFIWSHFPYNVKCIFHQVFSQGKRLTTEQLLSNLQKYQDMLSKGKASDELFPKNFKIINPVSAICSKCGRQCQANADHLQDMKAQGKEFICNDCRLLNIVTCSKCGRKFDEWKCNVLDIKRSGKSLLCPDCRKSLSYRQVGLTQRKHKHVFMRPKPKKNRQHKHKSYVNKKPQNQKSLLKKILKFLFIALGTIIGFSIVLGIVIELVSYLLGQVWFWVVVGIGGWIFSKKK